MKVIPNQCNINEYQSSIFSIIENNRKILLNAGKTVKRGKTLSTTMTKYKIKKNKHNFQILVNIKKKQ